MKECISSTPIGLSNNSVFPKSPKFGTFDTPPCFTVSKKKITFYCMRPDIIKNSSHSQHSLDNLKKAHTMGLMNVQTGKRIKTIIELWSDSILFINEHFKDNRYIKKRHLTFVTLTLPSKQIHSDLRIKRDCLFRFIEYIQQFYDLKYYIWRAERQRNGNIHFHLIFDSYVDYKVIRKVWNMMLNRLGYIDRFFNIHKHSNPNSTDVHQVVNQEKISEYASKYITKTDYTEKIEGHVWGCSNELKLLKKEVHLLDNYTAQLVLQYASKDIFNVFADEYFSVINCKNSTTFDKLHPFFKSLIDKQNETNYNFLYNNNNDFKKPIESLLTKIKEVKPKIKPIQQTLFEIPLVKKHHYD